MLFEKVRRCPADVGHNKFPVIFLDIWVLDNHNE